MAILQKPEIRAVHATEATQDHRTQYPFLRVSEALGVAATESNI
jgi:hypothetical protein